MVIAASFHEMKAGHHVLYIDFEDDEGGIAGRLLTLQLPADMILKQFHYLRPKQSVNTEVNLADLFDTLETHNPLLAVIDGITEAMTTHGKDPNKNKDIAEFAAMLPRKLADWGCATVCLDHVPKSTDNRGRYALGGVHKLNGLDGAAYILEARDPFGVGITGRSTILIAKDRPGQLRKHAYRRKDGLCNFGELVLTSHDDTYAEFEIKPAVEHKGEFRPTKLMAKVSDALQEHGPLSQRRIIAAVGGKRDYVIKALDVLILDGNVTEKSPHELLRPYVESEDLA
jgi:hypothetical protein